MIAKYLIKVTTESGFGLFVLPFAKCEDDLSKLVLLFYDFIDGNVKQCVV